MMSREVHRNGNGGNKVDSKIDFKPKSIKVNNSVGDVVIEAGKYENNAQKSDRGKIAVPGGSIVYMLGLMNVAGIQAKTAFHEIKEWEKSVMGRNITIPVGEDDKRLGGESMRYATAFENMGRFGNLTFNNAINLEDEIRKRKGESKKVEENSPYNSTKAVVIVHSNDFTVGGVDESIIRVDQSRIGTEIGSLVFHARKKGIDVNNDTFKKELKNINKTVIKLGASGKPIFDVNFDGNKPTVKPKGVVHAPRLPR